MKILIFGSKGYIGGRMLEAWPEAVGTSARIDDKEAVLKALEEHQPDAVVNAAGKTGKPNVDWCETHQAETFQSNVTGVLTLAQACQERGVYLLHLASGCIFYGPSPDPKGWREDDFANPSAFYSRTQYAADLILSRLPNVGIARLRMPIDDRPAARNLIDKLANYKQVIDVANSVTVVEDLLNTCYSLVQKRGRGIFHVVNPGVMRHQDLLRLYREYVDPNHSCEWITAENLVARGLAIKARSNCILQSEHLRELGIEMRPIDVALRDTMIKYAKAIQAESTDNDSPNAPHLDSVQAANSFQFLREKPKQMKGVILAGGRGTRLSPLTNITNKHLLPVADKQMILYPLQTLLQAGIRQIMVVTGPDHAGHFMNLLGSGKEFGCNLTYRIQDESGGVAHALNLTKDFVDGDNCTVILGDNLFDENFFPHISSFKEGAMTFYKAVDDPQRFGVMELDSAGHVLSIEEKPEQPKSNFAQVGLYIYDEHAFEIISNLQPSKRGELEVTDLNNTYLRQGKLTARPVRGFWSDAGTFQSLQQATEFFSQRSNKNA